MKYYSEKTRKLYDNEKDLKNAELTLVKHEAEEKAKREQRSARAKEVEEAFNNYKKLLDAFLKDYGSYHTTFTNSNCSIFDWIFDTFKF